MKPTNTVRAEIHEDKFYESSRGEDWEVLMPREISGPDDKKPSDSVGDLPIKMPKVLGADKIAERVVSVPESRRRVPIKLPQV